MITIIEDIIGMASKYLGREGVRAFLSFTFSRNTIETILGNYRLTGLFTMFLQFHPHLLQSVRVVVFNTDDDIRDLPSRNTSLVVTTNPPTK
jgi:hypothetical protein